MKTYLKEFGENNNISISGDKYKILITDGKKQRIKIEENEISNLWSIWMLYKGVERKDNKKYTVFGFKEPVLLSEFMSSRKVTTGKEDVIAG